MYNGRWSTDSSQCEANYIIFSSKQIQFFADGKEQTPLPVKRVLEDSSTGGVMFVIRVPQSLADRTSTPDDTSDAGFVFLPKGDRITLVGEGDPNHLMPVTPKDKNYAKFDLRRCK